MVIIRLDQPVSFELLSMEFNIDKKTLVRWNPEYEAFEAHNYVTPYYKLRFPKDKSADFVMRKEALTKKSHDLYYKK